MFIFLKFEFFSGTHSGAIGESFRENLLIKSRNQNIFENLKQMGISGRFPLKLCIICLCYVIGSQMNGVCVWRGGGGGG